MSDLNRLSLSIENSLCQKLDDMVQKHNYRNRSEFIRDLLRDKLVEEQWNNAPEVLGTITLIYDHHQRELNARLTRIQHDSHAHILAGTHVHLSHEICAEMIMLRGQGAGIQKLANALQQLKGVYHAELAICSPGDEFLGA